jgi:serine/threonine protein kinase
MRKPRERAGTVFGDWTITELLGVGGNGEAWLAKNAEGDSRVVKVLTRRGDESYERFRREVKTVREVVALGHAVLPIDAVHLPQTPTRGDKPFFVMPRAERIDKALAGATLTAKVDAIAALTDTLAQLAASHDLHHRDVKPSNLYRYGENFVLGDFGLVKTADDSDLTADEQIVGPWNFLPSEVFNPRGPID